MKLDAQIVPIVPAADSAPIRHPLGSGAKILLTSVFGPYAQDDEYGSRAINPMELYHNQVTRVQGPFSLRLFHRSWGLMLIQANVEAPCTILDFPTLDRFIDELRTHQYDVVGIGAIVANFLKVEKLCELVREHLPEAKVIVGGHVAALADLDQRMNTDHVVGVRESAGSASFWDRTPSNRSGTRRSSRVTARGLWE